MTRQSVSSLKSFWFLVLSAALLTAVFVDRAEAGRGKPDDWFVRSDKPRHEKMTQGLLGGEKRDILPPAPGMPIPQSERTKPPSPDYLMAKVQWGQSVVVGDTVIRDWNLAPNDILEFIQQARANGFKYLHSNTVLTGFSYDPKLMPSILIGGVREVRFSAATVDKLREYVLNGGMIICDSVYGSPWFYESALKLFDDMFPESRFRVLPEDHPLYHMVVDIDKVDYRCGRDDQKPFLEGLYIGSRVGVLVSRYGLGCGWQGELKVFDTLEKRGLSAKAYSMESARQIGMNLAPYILGYAQVGEVEGKPEMFGLADQKRPTAEFVFAQVKHDGAWNAHPGAARSLLTILEKESSIPVNLKRVSVNIASDDVSAYPFLYFTGLDDFRLSDQQVKALRTYAKEGGALLINNALGLAKFHQAALREISRVFPDKDFGVLPVGHEIYRSLHKIDEVKYTPTLTKDKGAELDGRPVLYGMEFDDKLRVIYSPYDLEAGWNEIRYPLSRGYQSPSAKKLGMNVIMYFMTH